jgi:hypothetical protein
MLCGRGYSALELPSITITAFRGSPQRFVRALPEVRRTNQHCFNLLLVLSGAWQVTNVDRAQLGSGDLIFYDSRTPIEIGVLHSWGDINLQLSEQFVRDWLPNPAWLSGRRIARDSQWGR